MGFSKANKRSFPHSSKNGGKPKRSKKFWQQRPTINLRPAEEEKELSSSGSENDEEEEMTEYDALLKVYGAQTDQVISEEESSESDEEEATNKTEEEQLEEEEVVDEDIESEIDEEESQSIEEEESVEDEEIGEDVEIESEEIDDDVENEEDILNAHTKDSEICSPSDPFTYRYELELQPSVLRCLESSTSFQSVHALSFKSLGSAEARLLKLGSVSDGDEKSVLLEDKEESPEENHDINERKIIRTHQLESIKKAIPTKFSSLSQMHVVNRLLNTAPDKNWSNLEKEFFSILNSYKDIYYPQRDSSNADKLRSAYVLHAANHILKSKAKIVSNNVKAKSGIEVRDQGLVRPKVLIIVPFRESARKVINALKDCLYSLPGEISKNVANNARFMEDFGDGAIDLPEKRIKPDDFYETFAGNVDDSFKIGISFGNKGIKLYSEFYSSDIIIASPLGLRIIIGVEGDKDRDFDFLNSIEMLIMDQMEVFSMQNWDHVLELMAQLHKKPLKSHGVDFGRVRLWSLNGLNKYYRQSIFISGIRMPEINSLFNKECFNYMGKIKVNNLIKSGTICRVSGSINAPMTFRRFVSTGLTTSPETRFNFFISKILPDYTKDSMFHTLIFVPSYFDFVRLRNHFNTSSYDYGEICEYTKDKNIAAARDNFFHNELHFILYTERCHFYRRFRIKGIRHLVFYQLPQNPQFYSELVNFMLFQNRKGGGSDGHMSVTVLYDKYDVHRVSAVTGSERCSKMYSSDKSTHMFMSNDS